MEQLACMMGMWLIFGGICSAIASSKGRNPVGWFFAGFLGIVGIVIIAVLPNLKEQEAKERVIADENRRLREQLRQEKLKSETFRQHATRRLDIHDQHLGVDTRAPLALEGASSAAPAGQLGVDLPGAPGAPPSLEDRDPLTDLAAATEPELESWYYESQGQTIGPVPAERVDDLLRQGAINGQTLLWSQNLVNWTVAQSVPRFRYSALS